MKKIFLMLSLLLITSLGFSQTRTVELECKSDAKISSITPSGAITTKLFNGIVVTRSYAPKVYLSYPLDVFTRESKIWMADAFGNSVSFSLSDAPDYSTIPELYAAVKACSGTTDGKVTINGEGSTIDDFPLEIFAPLAATSGVRLDTPRVVINGKGHLGMGFEAGTSPAWPFHVQNYWYDGATKYFETTKFGDQVLYLEGIAPGIGGERRISFKRAKGDGTSRDSTKIVENGDYIGRIRFDAHDGTNYDNSAAIDVYVEDPLPENDAIGVKMSFMVQDSSGNLKYPLVLDPNLGLDMRMPLALSTAASAPTNPVEGMMYANGTDNTIYYYDGTSFQDMLGGGATALDGLSDAVASDGTSIYLGDTGGSDTGNNRNIGLGYNIFSTLGDGEDNIAIGNQVLNSSEFPYFNVGIGNQVLTDNGGQSNVAIGYQAMGFADGNGGSSNVAIGEGALYNNGGAGSNVAIGYYAGYGSGTLADTDENVMIGSNSGGGLLDGSDKNVIIGARAAGTLDTGSENIYIGYDMEPSAVTVSNELRIGTGVNGQVLSSPNMNAVNPIVQIDDVLQLDGITAAQASALTAADGMIVYVTDTDATFTTIGFWMYENGSWVDM